MPANCALPGSVVDQIRRVPVHAVLLDLGTSAREMNLHGTDEFRKLVAYLLEVADGRDRREPWMNKPGIARPVPRLRIALEKCFGEYADLQWFKLNKTANQSGLPLCGLFPRAAASLARVQAEDFGEMVEALVGDAPEPSLMRLLHRNTGRIKGLGVELLSRVAHAFRRDLFFVIPKAWGETSGCQKFIGNDLRKYCAMCRTLRSVCDQLDVDTDIRSSVFFRAMEAETLYDPLREVLHRAIGPTLARFKVLDPDDAYVSESRHDDQASMPLEFAASAIRCRRGDKRLRNQLLTTHGNRCAITGANPIDLLEVAYIVPFPDGNVQDASNALLLRSDLHTLWDVNLIAVNPETLAVHVSPKLEGTAYENIDGRRLGNRADMARLSREALRERWTAFAGATGTPKKPRTRREPSEAPVPSRPGAESAPVIEIERPSPIAR